MEKLCIVDMINHFFFLINVQKFTVLATQLELVTIVRLLESRASFVAVLVFLETLFARSSNRAGVAD